MADFLSSIPLPEKRDALEHLIEAAIARLDELDDDPDLEPSLGSVAGAMWGGTYWPPEWVAERMPQVPDECEDASDDEDGGDDEPTMGALETSAVPGIDVGKWMDKHVHPYASDSLPELHRTMQTSQHRWSDGSRRDECEEVSEDEGAACEDEGAEDDKEPSLGSLEHFSQKHWASIHSHLMIDGEMSGDEDDDDRCYLPPGALPKARPPGPVANIAERCLEAAHCLRTVQRTHGKPLSPLPVVIAGALFKR